MKRGEEEGDVSIDRVGRENAGGLVKTTRRMNGETCTPTFGEKGFQEPSKHMSFFSPASLQMQTTLFTLQSE